MRRQRLQTIAVAGALSRIGVTTQALQIVKYLQITGYHVCYIEMNDSDYPEKVLQLYQKARRGKSGTVKFEGIPLYKKETWREGSAGEYDFLVKDYGVVSKESFEEISFLEQDMLVLVCGVKPEEIEATEWALRKYGDACDRFLFDFVCEEERKEIRKMMMEKAANTYFMDYIPNPFFYTAASAPLCRSLLLPKR